MQDANVYIIFTMSKIIVKKMLLTHRINMCRIFFNYAFIYIRCVLFYEKHAFASLSPNDKSQPRHCFVV